jgi:putative DNA primase/helicase
MVLAQPPEILGRLEGVKREGKGWRAVCPAHQDTRKHPSLSVNVGENGKLLFKCWSGCTVEQIASALKMPVAELLHGEGKTSPVRQHRASNRGAEPQKRRVFDTIDAVQAAYLRHPKLAGATTVHRYDFDPTFSEFHFRFDDRRKKEVRPVSRNGSGWIRGDPAGFLPLYRVDELEPTGVIYIVEGPKDADAARRLGLSSTTWAHGANAWRKADWTPLQGRSTVLIADAHETGVKAMRGVAGKLAPLGCPVRLIERLPGVPEGGSVSDFIEAHDSRDDEDLRRMIEKIAAEAPEREPIPEAKSEPNDRASVRGGGFNRTEYGLAERIAAHHSDDLKHSVAHGWYVWDGSHWATDDTGEPMRRAKSTVRYMFLEALAMPEDKKAERKELIKFANACESAARLNAALELAKSEHPIPVRTSQLNADPWLFNVTNGTIDLRTGNIRKHRREDLITKRSPVKYEPSAECPQWLRFLQDVFDGKGELIEFVQRALGSSLAGVIREHVLHILHGGGANGKSTLIETVQYILGDYAKTAAPGLLLRTYGEPHPTQLADLFGARFVASAESGEGRRLDEERVKQLTGGDRIKGRYMRRDFFEFPPTHKLFFATNHKPEIRGTDYAIWRRIRLWPFDVTIPEERQDRELKEKLLAESSGILRWLVEGCSKWLAGGLREPDEVKAATSAYRSDSDVVQGFIDECCTTGPTLMATAGTLYDAFVEHTGRKQLSKKAFGLRMKELGYETRRTGRQRRYHGIGLVEDSLQGEV